MKDEQTPLPRWFRALFVAAMLALSLELIWFVPQQYELHFRIDDIALSLDTSRQREAKQLYEYDQVSAELPLTLAELAAVQPLADEAEAREQELRTQRKALRAQSTELAASLEETQSAVRTLQTEADTLKSEVDALRLLEEALRQQVSDLLTQLGRTE